MAATTIGGTLPTPPEVWKDYDPDAGDLREEIVHEETKDGIYTKDAYISAYVNDEEVRVYCKYAVKAGAKNVPGLMDVHGWYGAPHITMEYVNDGWAVLAHDYAGDLKDRPHHTRYPAGLSHGNMAPSPVWLKRQDGSLITDATQASDYLWNAVQRRALSYLVAQEEVDPARIGAKGYSYGGTLMWNLGMDPRVKAIVAYFGIGWNVYYRDKHVWLYNKPYKEPAKTQADKIFLSAVAPQAHAPYITAASLWLNGSNDHHGGHERGDQTFRMFAPGVPWDYAVQARGHHNTEKLGDNCKLWLEKHVLGTDHFWPERPGSEIKLGNDGVLELHLTPASPDRITELQVYQCLKTANNIERHWRDVESVRRDGKIFRPTGDGPQERRPGNLPGHAKAERMGTTPEPTRGSSTWVAKLPVINVDDYVFSYANIRYENDCVVSSDFEAVIPSTLGNAVATDKKSDVMPEGTGQWSHVAPVEGVGGIQGFRPLNNRWGTSSKQFSDPKWQAPQGADLSFQFYCTQPQALVLEVNHHFAMDLDITASDEWQTMVIRAEQLKRKVHNFPLGDWSEVTSLTIKPKPGADITKVVFANFRWGATDLTGIKQ